MPTYRSPTRMLSTLLLAVFLAQPTSTQAGPILFDFETPPISDLGDGINPLFSLGDLTIRFVNPRRNGVAQWTNDRRSVPRTGNGSMRLVGSISDVVVDADVELSMAAREIRMDLANLKKPNTNFVDAQVSALGENGEILKTIAIVPKGSFDLPEWSNISFQGIGTIASLHLVGVSHDIYLDNLEIMPVPEPSTMALILIICFSVFAVRSKMQL